MNEASPEAIGCILPDRVTDPGRPDAPRIPAARAALVVSVVFRARRRAQSRIRHAVPMRAHG